MARFLNGLNPLIARKVDLQTYFTLDDVFKIALKVEKWRKEKRVFSQPFPKKQVSSKPPFKPISHPKPKGTTRVDKGKALALPSLKELPKQFKGKKCFKCQGYGHFQYDCPNQRVMTMQEVEEVDALLMKTQEEAHEAESDFMEEETQLEVDEGELLVLRRVLHTQVLTLSLCNVRFWW